MSSRLHLLRKAAQAASAARGDLPLSISATQQDAWAQLGSGTPGPSDSRCSPQAWGGDGRSRRPAHDPSPHPGSSGGPRTAFPAWPRLASSVGLGLPSLAAPILPTVAQRQAEGTAPALTPPAGPPPPAAAGVGLTHTLAHAAHAAPGRPSPVMHSSGDPTPAQPGPHGSASSHLSCDVRAGSLPGQGPSVARPQGWEELPSEVACSNPAPGALVADEVVRNAVPVPHSTLVAAPSVGDSTTPAWLLPAGLLDSLPLPLALALPLPLAGPIPLGRAAALPGSSRGEGVPRATPTAHATMPMVASSSSTSLGLTARTGSNPELSCLDGDRRLPGSTQGNHLPCPTAGALASSRHQAPTLLTPDGRAEPAPAATGHPLPLPPSGPATAVRPSGVGGGAVGPQHAPQPTAPPSPSSQHLNVKTRPAPGPPPAPTPHPCPHPRPSPPGSAAALQPCDPAALPSTTSPHWPLSAGPSGPEAQSGAALHGKDGHRTQQLLADLFPDTLSLSPATSLSPPSSPRVGRLPHAALASAAGQEWVEEGWVGLGGEATGRVGHRVGQGTLLLGGRGWAGSPSHEQGPWEERQAEEGRWAEPGALVGRSPPSGAVAGPGVEPKPGARCLRARGVEAGESGFLPHPGGWGQAPGWLRSLAGPGPPALHGQQQLGQAATGTLPQAKRSRQHGQQEGKPASSSAVAAAAAAAAAGGGGERGVAAAAAAAASHPQPRKKARSSHAFIALNKDIMAASSVEALLGLVQARRGDLDFFNVSTAVARLPKLLEFEGVAWPGAGAAPGSGPGVGSGVGLAMSGGGSQGPGAEGGGGGTGAGAGAEARPGSTPASKLSSAAKAWVAGATLPAPHLTSPPPHTRLASSLHRPTHTSTACNPLSPCSRPLATSLPTPPPHLRPAAAQLAQLLGALVAQHLPDFDARAVANSAWAFAKLRYVPDPALPRLLCGEALVKLDGFGAQNLANMAWAMVYLHHRDERLLSVLAHKLGLVAGELKPQEVANAMWALASLEHMPPNTLVALSARTLQVVHQLKEQELSNIMWAAGRLRGVEPSLLLALVTEAHAKMPTFLPQGVSNIVWAMGQLQHQDTGFLRAVAHRFSHRMQAFDTQALANLAQGVGALGWREPPLGQAILSEAALRLAGDWISPNNLANLAWSAAVLGLRNDSFDHALAAVLAARGSSLEAGPLAVLLWSQAHLQAQGQGGPAAQQVLDAVERAACAWLPRHTAQGLLHLASALSSAPLPASLLDLAVAVACKLEEGPPLPHQVSALAALRRSLSLAGVRDRLRPVAAKQGCGAAGSSSSSSSSTCGPHGCRDTATSSSPMAAATLASAADVASTQTQRVSGLAAGSNSSGGQAGEWAPVAGAWGEKLLSQALGVGKEPQAWGAVHWPSLWSLAGGLGNGILNVHCLQQPCEGEVQPGGA